MLALGPRLEDVLKVALPPRRVLAVAQSDRAGPIRTFSTRPRSRDPVSGVAAHIGVSSPTIMAVSTTRTSRSPNASTAMFRVERHWRRCLSFLHVEECWSR